MKIEKLTENKIRVIVSHSDLQSKNIDNSHIFNNILKILESADKQVGFKTDGCKLLIETVSSFDDTLVFTITKYSSDTGVTKTLRTVKPPRKINPSHSKRKKSIYKFETFDEFCNFCNHIYHVSNFDINDFYKDVSLFLYNNTYYLVAKNPEGFAKTFDCIASEFSSSISYKPEFVNKLLEYGEVVWG